LSTTQTNSENILNRIERIADIGHWRWDVGSNTLFWSEGIFKIHGITDFEGFTPNVDAAIDAYLPEDRIDVENILTSALEAKEGFEFQKRIRRPNGDIRHVISQGECEIDENGKVVALHGILQDITPVKSQEELYELAAKGSSAALLDWDIDYDKIRWAGRSAEILGYDDNVFLPKDSDEFYYEFIHRKDVMALQVAFVEHFKTRETFSVDLRIKKQNGTFEWFTIRAQAQFDDNDRALRLCGSLTSIDDLKKAIEDLSETKDQLEHSNKDLENFASIAAHDLKDPLRSISGYLDMLESEYSDTLNDQAREYIHHAASSANSLSAMVEDLLAYASMQSHNIQLQNIDLNKLIKLLIRNMKALIKEHDAKIEFEKLPNLVCDEHKITRLFANIIQNAIKYRAKESPVIEIEFKEHDDYLEVSIKDNGIGIPDNALDNVFDMFQRVNTHGEVSGTGIGLATCKRITELHDGKIWVDSKIGEGSTFFFTLSKHLGETHG